MQDPDRRLVKSIDVRLQQFVAREGLEDVSQGFGGVPAGRKGGAPHHRFDLATQERDLARAASVSGRGVEAEEPMLAEHLPIPSVTFDTDEIEPGRAVHGGTRIRFGERERIAWSHGRLTQRCRQGGEARRALRLPVTAEDTERTAGFAKELRSVRFFEEEVTRSAQEHEIVGREPTDEGTDLVEVVCRYGFGWRPALLRRSFEQRAHRLPIVDRGPNVAEHPQQIGFEDGEASGVAQPVDLDVDEALHGGIRLARLGHGEEQTRGIAPHRQDGVDGEVHGEPVPRQFHAHAVDEERHVVVHDLDDRVGRLPSVLLDRRIVHPHRRRAGGPPQAEPEMREDGTVEVERIQDDEVGGRDAFEPAARERTREYALARIDTLRNRAQDGQHELGCALLDGRGHRKRLRGGRFLRTIEARSGKRGINDISRPSLVAVIVIGYGERQKGCDLEGRREGEASR
jgi:hypothetical protein